MRAVGILLTVCLFALAANAAVELRCPTVYDGATSGVFDMSTQFSTTSLSANWFGLENSEVLGYEYAIISDNLATKAMQSRDCRPTQGFLGNPDVQGWTDVRKLSSFTAKNLSLEPTRTYFVVIRTTLSNGVHAFSNSNGVIVMPAELEQEFHEWSSKRVESGMETRDHIPSIPIGADCPIEQNNRCRQSQENVHDFLNQIYGPPTFADDSQLALLFRFPTTPFAAAQIGVAEELAGQPNQADDDDGDDDDDDDDGSAIGGIIAGVVIGVIVLMLLCLLLLALLGFFIARGDDNEKFNERITERRQEDVDADFGTRTERTIESEATRVEFPDIDTHSRLSEAPM
mmetsp:Transcript_7193/g.30644  ORF Transcript_7193/g.30644 Transcript_7193/m.30644 type:complete len:344 (-) Transcript_7193:44-1075(-)|eukprot:CAMPEP_0114611824 /NCGR_PEP_ID=MMETSP0168-20121206/4313_1 /TAXON_ID=95228 ORGANISM="Vannella sp., Strain DIVA3 517/6/12" /NCGR_SAMPLE_ID=MMETSP0168 /ASSEMBLY_ACC=CAM_ASM_000044 /LENGTH=343 /DNA_ID=CAMNT_0001822805 /DNA_START=154 /DNA_END=1185 /DNA_ORIENTATION=+